MIGRLPRWAWPAAWLLAFAAGAVNAIGFLSVAREAVSHLTGTTTLIAIAFVEHDPAYIGRLISVAAAFVAGATVGGLAISSDPLHLGVRHSAVLVAVAAVLALAAWAMPHAIAIGLPLIAAACGLQNAMTTAYSGAIVRTTHVSGMFTDLGIALGRTLRGEPFDRRRVLMCIAVITGFFAGGLAAAAAHRATGTTAFVIPIVVTMSLAAANAVRVMRGRHRSG